MKFCYLKIQNSENDFSNCNWIIIINSNKVHENYSDLSFIKLANFVIFFKMESFHIKLSPRNCMMTFIMRCMLCKLIYKSSSLNNGGNIINRRLHGMTIMCYTNKCRNIMKYYQTQSISLKWIKIKRYGISQICKKS